MAAKKTGKSTKKLIEGVFKKYPGSKLAEFLKEGACIQARVEGDPFALEKKDGDLEITEGLPESPDISVELNREACEYLASSRELEDFVTRTRECVDRSHGKCEMTYEINANVVRMLSKGYLDFARRMGII